MPLAVGALSIAAVNCGFSSNNANPAGTAGSGSNGAAGTSQSGSAGDTNPTTGAAGNTNPTTGAAGNTNPTTGTAGTPGSGGSSSATAGSTGTAGGGAAGSTGAAGTSGAAGASAGGAKNYEISGTWPNWPVAVKQIANPNLNFKKVVIQTQFLAESCSIGDYNEDGIPDVSSGRIWYQGPDFKTTHAFRSGHGALPRNGDPPEINTGVSDDWMDFPFDINHDGHMDIVNIAQCDVDEITYTNPKIGTVQVHATAYWYENPGPAGQAGDPMWVPHLMNSDVRLEQHGVMDFNKDGYPEFYGACKGCTPAETKGYYQGDPTNPTAQWVFHSVTVPYTFPFGGTGWLHGLGGGDINGDGLPDLVERGGAWIQQPGGTWNQTVCTGPNTPAGCGWIKAGTNLVKSGFWAGDPPYGPGDSVGNWGASNIVVTDMDGDGCNDVVAANWAHGVGLYWYQQQKGTDGKCDWSFKKYEFMGDSINDSKTDPPLWGAGFTEPHALEVWDMDGDGRPDVIAGKMRFAHPHTYGDPDSDGTPYLYVFQNKATTNMNSKDNFGSGTYSPITLTPVEVDPVPHGAWNAPIPGAIGTPDGGMGVGRHYSIGHVDTDGSVDICVGTKVGLAVFLGQP